MVLRPGEPVRLHHAARGALSRSVDVVQLQDLAFCDGGLDRPNDRRHLQVPTLLEQPDARYQLAGPSRLDADIAATSFRSADLAESPNGIGPLAASATATAVASSDVKLSGGKLISGSTEYPPPGPGVAQIGTPDCWSAEMSRSIVRTLTSNRSASSVAVRARGADARSTSAIA